MIELRVTGKVPAKANTYEIRTVPVKGRTRCIMASAKDVKAYQERVGRSAEALRNQLGGEVIYPDQPVELWLFWHRLYHDGARRDLDNIIKAVKDGLTDGKIWSDDSQVSQLVVTKSYDAEEEEWLDIVIQLDPLCPRPGKKRRPPKPSSP